jgi:hypothetical protein
MSKFRIVETAHYVVEAKDEEEALKLFLNAEDRDERYFVEVSDRDVINEDGDVTEGVDLEANDR